MSRGVYLPELEVKTQPCRITRINNNVFRIVLTQGLNRQIRRMCAEFGANVRQLRRVRIINIKLGDLPVGKWR